MPIPSEFDHALGEIDDLAALVMIKLRTLRYAGAHPETVRDPLDRYVEAVMSLAGIER